jgi:DTW domain-containing protein YfiP
VNARAFCYRCHKAQSVCVCDSIPVVDNATEVIVVQHPRERHHPIGSLRFARLGLQRCRISVAEPAEDGGLRAKIELPEGSMLLYPGPDSVELETLPMAERPRQLVLLDGTWTTVRKLLDGDPRLRALPKVRMTPTVEQRYRIRREPRGECMSTLEAMVSALALLEPEREAQWETLLSAFDQMIDRQIEIVAERGRPRKKRPRTRQQFRPVPPTLGLEHGPLIIAHVETTQVNRIGVAGTRQRRQIVRLSALRLVEGMAPERFDELVHVEGKLPKAKQLQFMGIDAEQLHEGLPLDELHRRWATFARPSDRRAAWTQLDLDLLPDAAASAERFVLKGIYANLRRRRAGELEATCAREGLAPAAATSERGIRRLDAAHRLFGWLSAHRRQAPSIL